MATDFSNKASISKPITVGSKKQNDLPLDVRTRIETLDEINQIEYPYIGMLFYVKENDTYYSVKSLKSEELVPGMPSTRIDNYRIGEYEEFEADSSTEEDILISGIPNLGGLMEGQIIPAGTTFTEFLKMLLQKPEEFEYIMPTLELKPEPELLQEVGTKISPVLKYEFNKNDAGDIKLVIYGPEDKEQQSETTIMDRNNIKYELTAIYEQGEQKYDDFGNPVGLPIPSGTLKAQCQYSGFRYRFFGADDKTVPCENSEEIRQLNKTLEDKFTLVAPTGSQRITIAVPIGSKQPVSVEYEQQGDVEYISNFTKNVIKVSGATPEENMMDYVVYSFIFLIPCAAKMTFNVTLE